MMHFESFIDTRQCCVFTTDDCPDPGPVKNGNRSPAAGPFHHGDKINFTCDAGYKLDDAEYEYELGWSSVLRCDYGHFNQTIPKCVLVPSGKISFIACTLNLHLLETHIFRTVHLSHNCTNAFLQAHCCNCSANTLCYSFCVSCFFFFVTCVLCWVL